MTNRPYPNIYGCGINRCFALPANQQAVAGSSSAVSESASLDSQEKDI